MLDIFVLVKSDLLSFYKFDRYGFASSYLLIPTIYFSDLPLFEHYM